MERNLFTYYYIINVARIVEFKSEEAKHGCMTKQARKTIFFKVSPTILNVSGYRKFNYPCVTTRLQDPKLLIFG